MVFDPKELALLLERGRQLEQQITGFIRNPDSASRQYLLMSINELIRDIKPKLINPSLRENDQVSLIVIQLASIMKKLQAIKYSLEKI